MRHTTSSGIPDTPARIVLTCVLILVPISIGLTACGGSSSSGSAAPYDATDQISFNAVGGTVRPGRPLEITSTTDDGRITDVTAEDSAGRRLSGELAADGSRWRSTAPPVAGTRYTVRVSTENGDGRPGRRTLTFDTEPAADGERLKVELGPEPGTYGVGQPLTAELSHGITDSGERAVVERALQVRSSPAVRGSWHWVDEKTLRYRPAEYWPAHATISVTSALDGLHIREGLYGEGTERHRIRTGDRVVAVTDIDKHTMTFRRNGEVVRTIPVTTGKEGFRTRNGVKVILAKQQRVRMRGTSVGIAAGSAESYDLMVHWAARLTHSGEYVHGAPWSAGSHGSANVSHGCTGMSTENARWFFNQVRRGDVVVHRGGEGEEMTPFDNGFGDWNLSWRQWRSGSAASARKPAGGTADAARLRPLVG